MSILVITSRTEPLRIVELEPRTQIVGRSLSADILIADRSVSRSHARIDFDEATGGHTIRDLASFNGVYRNGERLTGEHPLADGDTLSLGSATLRFRAEMHAPEGGEKGDGLELNEDVPTAAPEWAVRTPWRDSVSA